MQFPPLPDWFWYPITFIYGAIVGSFLNVVIYRMPLGMSIWQDGSHCPHCNSTLRAWDNIPILGFLLLGGRCRYCRAPISWRYLSVELVTACLWVALYDRVSGTSGVSWVDFVGQALFASVLIAMVFIDLDHFLALDELNAVGFWLALCRDVICLVLAYRAGGYVWEEWWPRFAYWHFLPRAIPGALVYGGILFAVSVVGFIKYARYPGESLAQVLRRYRSGDDEDFVEEAEPIPVAMAPEELVSAAPTADDDPEAVDDRDEEDQAAPPRLRLSPGFLAVVSALLLSTVAGWWGILALLIPALSFGLLSRREDEPFSGAVLRFFKSDEDDNYAPAAEDSDVAAAAEEAAEFAKEAETGAHGGMGQGDVKLALAIGALLGPVLSLLSLFVATFFGAVTGIAIAVRTRRGNLRYGVPFVPFMALGAIVTMLYGPAFMTWYVGLMQPRDAITAPRVYVQPPRGIRRRARRLAQPYSAQRGLAPSPASPAR